jgi:hypothetical protein
MLPTISEFPILLLHLPFLTPSKQKSERKRLRPDFSLQSASRGQIRLLFVCFFCFSFFQRDGYGV